MRLSLTGAANTGKTSLLQSFLHTWKTYKTPEKTYRDIIEEKQLEHSSKTTTETQTEILNFMSGNQNIARYHQAVRSSKSFSVCRSHYKGNTTHMNKIK